MSKVSIWNSNGLFLVEGGEGLFYRKESILCMPSAISIFTPETNAILLTLKFAAPSYISKQSSDSLPGILAIESRKLRIPLMYDYIFFSYID
jgi:hypothetical protein